MALLSLQGLETVHVGHVGSFSKVPVNVCKSEGFLGLCACLAHDGFGVYSDSANSKTGCRLQVLGYKAYRAESAPQEFLFLAEELAGPA